MNDNPCTKDLVTAGWTDFNTVLIIARTEEMLNSYIERTKHIFVSLDKEEGKLFAHCVIQDEIEIFQNIIDEMGLTKDMKLIIAEREELYLNEILDKINNSGKESLTSREYSFLNFVKYLH